MSSHHLFRVRDVSPPQKLVLVEAVVFGHTDEAIYELFA